MVVHCLSKFGLHLCRKDIRVLQTREYDVMRANTRDVVGNVPKVCYHAGEQRIQDKHHAQLVESEVFHVACCDMVFRYKFLFEQVSEGILNLALHLFNVAKVMLRAINAACACITFNIVAISVRATPFEQKLCCQSRWQVSDILMIDRSSGQKEIGRVP